MLPVTLLACLSCEFGETTIPESEPIVVVHSVMRPDRDRQWVLVEQTLTGSQAEDSVGGRIPGDAPQLPLTGAIVTVTNRTMPSDSCGTVFFTEDPAVAGLSADAGLYWGPSGCPTMRGGDTLELRIETISGHLVVGTSEIPAADSMMLRAAGAEVVVPGPMLTMNRDRDTLAAAVFIGSGRGVQLEVGTPDSIGRAEINFGMFVDSTAIKIPGTLPNFFELVLGEEDSISADEVEPVFTAGRYYNAVVALFDDRYFDYARSGNMPLSGRGFVNNLQGGMGVFGSLISATSLLRVIGELDDPREGLYNVTGAVRGVPVDVTLELYVSGTGRDTTDLSTFVEGSWELGGIDTYANGHFAGRAVWFHFYQALVGQQQAPNAYLVEGIVAADGTFDGSVLDRDLEVIGSVSGGRAQP